MDLKETWNAISRMCALQTTELLSGYEVYTRLVLSAPQ